jgi:hypothetical protein
MFVEHGADVAGAAGERVGARTELGRSGEVEVVDLERRVWAGGRNVEEGGR